jgi:hypothetical protein
MKKSNVMARIALVLSIGLAPLLLKGCDPSDFGDLNEDPTRASEISPQFLFTRSLVYGSLRYDVYQRGQHLFGSMYAQHFANLIPTWPTDRYESGGVYDDWATAFWRSSYASYGGIQFVGENVSNFGINNEHVLRLTAGRPEMLNMNAQARIWKAFYFHRITDMWGDVPYSEAFRGDEGILTPRYDTQEEIYRDLLRLLREAAADINPTPGPQTVRMGSADVLYGDDLQRWRRFANSLRLRLAMRLSEVDPDLARQNVQEALAGGVMETLEQSARLRMGTTEGRFVNRNPLAVIQLFDDDRVSALMVDKLVERQDPRLQVYADSIEARRDPVRFRGLPNGLSAADLSGIRRVNYSKLGLTVRGDNWPVPLLTYPEVRFLQAEAALRGWGPGTPREHYEAGIRASMNMYGIMNSGAIDTYLQRLNVAYPEAGSFEEQLEAIITQKWIALFTDGFEAWAEVRRTGYPRLRPVDGGATGGQLPRRVLYVREEYNTNASNVQAAANRIGGDTMLSRVWWDVRP